MLVPAESAHLTMSVLQLCDAEAVEEAQKLLSGCADLVQAHFGGKAPHCRLKGLGVFGDRCRCCLLNWCLYVCMILWTHSIACI